MASTPTFLMKTIFLVFIFVSFTISPATSTAPEDCASESANPCVDKAKALPLKIIAIAAILVASMIGVGAPLFSRNVPFLQPDGNIFTIVKCFASGIILGTGFMHVLPDSFEMLSSQCLKENPWHKFPFSGFLAMLSGLITLVIDSMATSIYTRKNAVGIIPHGHGHGPGNDVTLPTKDGDSADAQLLRYRVIAMVLELGIIVHSVVIGLSLGATSDTCTIKGLIAALCFHQMFEGMGLGGCILQAEYTNLNKFLMAFFFAITTPFGIALGIALSTIYRDNSPSALITVGLLNACSAGLLIYMALVDLLAAEFMGPKLQGSIKMQIKCFIAALLGCEKMASTSTLLMKTIFILLIFVSFTISPATSTAPEHCGSESANSCINKAKALPLKIVAIATILVASMIGVGAPLFSSNVPFLQPDGNIFIIVKCFASGIILGTGFMHVLPDSFEMLSSQCLEENPWHKFPFSGFLAMLSSLITLFIDSMATSIYASNNADGVVPYGPVNGVTLPTKVDDSAQLLRYRVIAMVLELGIIVHSVVIGLSLGATNDICTIKSLITALCFHQMFEGIGLGGCILQAEYTKLSKFLMAFFFAITTPFGIALGIALSTIYRNNSHSALITVGLLNACSSGLLIYMALVDLLAADFMGPKLQGSVKMQIKCFVAALLGCVLVKTMFLVLIFVSFTISPATSTAPEDCASESANPCVNKTKALPLKIIAIAAILVASMIGVGAPLFSRNVPFLQPDGNIFTIVKCFASGIILGTGFMHVLPDSFEMLSSQCLKENPWHKFPFSGFLAMLSGLITLVIDSMATSIYTRKNAVGIIPHGHGHGPGNDITLPTKDGDSADTQLLRYRVIAMVLELGIIVHSVVIGLSLGATSDTCTIKGLIAALCFHQIYFQAEYTNLKKFLMAFFFAITTPFGIALGIALSTIYRDNSPSALITVGLLNACSAGLLIYMALVDLLAAEFMGPKLQGSIKMQIKCFIAALLGCGGIDYPNDGDPLKW
ncbi:hypothetical protein HID58_001043 [Brassica napus]|uniref:Uncharacterized protein n=1 Tax=Brassica napus TaxID=3708 RepID=A0ABQ8EL96_BRANA|nr:hypothetical protein HID58_001043 [Brassica napus]